MIQLPNFISFDPITIEGNALVDRYDNDRDLGVIVEGLLKMDVETMKRKVAGLPAVTTHPLGDLIADIESAVERCRELVGLFNDAACRLRIVGAMLV